LRFGIHLFVFLKGGVPMVYFNEKYKYFETILSYRSIVVIKLKTPNHKTLN